MSPPTRYILHKPILEQKNKFNKNLHLIKGNLFRLNYVVWVILNLLKFKFILLNLKL